MKFLDRMPSAKAPPERFTGDVWVDTIAEAQAPARLRAALVRFSPCARTAWHRHTLGQTLHVTEGIGLIQTLGGDVLVMRPGDTVHTPPGEWHWHGAAAHHFMTHLALSESTGDPTVPDVEWGEHVSEAEYEFEGNTSEA
ncbi:(R)-mandelonitrile lyase [Streptomyces geranii]|uniref:(R)-mandelonitrile lyase n=1 Tax=Streptomyces geranii TaxID=2058923 RepID=UPI000D02B36B|nr:cupin domain-containing protein [Streptomyces geranii]